MPQPLSPYAGNSTLALVARASLFGAGAIYGGMKLKFLQMKAESPKNAGAKAHH